MKHRAISTTVIVLMAGTTFSVANARAQSQTATPAQPPATGAPRAITNPPRQSASSPRTFINDLTIANLAEAQLGRTASERATSPDVRAFAQTMIDDHTAANNELAEVAKQLHITPPSQMDRKHLDLWSRLSKLHGAEFDREYMSAMVQGHEEVLAKLKAFSTSAADRPTGTSGSTRTASAPSGAEALTEWVSKTTPHVEEHLNRAKEIQGKAQ